MSKKIALAADHAGFEEKEKIKKTLDEIGVQYDDLGTDSWTRSIILIMHAR